MRKKSISILLLVLLFWILPESIFAQEIELYPKPTGNWVGEDLELYVEYAGNISDVEWTSSSYQFTSTIVPPSGGVWSGFSQQGKILVNQTGENYVHTRVQLKNGTTLRHTFGPYKLLKTPLSDFTLSVRTASLSDVVGWARIPIYLTLNYFGNETSDGIIHQYQIKGVHQEWQTMKDENGDGYVEPVELTHEGANEILGRVMDKAGKVSGVKTKTYQFDKTPVEFQHISLKKTAEGKYSVIAWATDAHSGIDSIWVETSEGNKLLSASPMSSVYKVDNLSVKPTNIVARDRAGNQGTASFLIEPQLTFSGYNPSDEMHRGIIQASLTGTDALSYSFEGENVTCTSNPCTFSINGNGLLTVSQDSGTRRSSVEMRINNVKNGQIRLFLQGERTSSSQITLKWNHTLASKTLTCAEGNQVKTYTVNGKQYVINSAINVTYKCQFKGVAILGETVDSNEVYIQSDRHQPFVAGSGFKQIPMIQNLYVEESRVGMSYFINVRRDNTEEGTETNLALFPESLFAP